MEEEKTMTPREKAMDYARAHLQPVRIVWLDKKHEVYGAVEAVALCSNCRVSGRIMAAVAHDKTLEAMLNKLIDGG